MDSIGSMTGFFGKEELVKRFGVCVDFIPNSFNVFFLKSGMIRTGNASRVGVTA